MLLPRDLLSMNSALRLSTLTIIASLLVRSSIAQTYSKCDPLFQSGCTPDPALGGSITADFRSGASSDFTESGRPTYGSDGAIFTISQSGDAPELISNWYIMFGKYEIVMKAAPGAGIVSSVVLQSDDLDEIDWEFLGAQNDAVQSNYFGKGQTTTYNRMEEEAVSDSQNEWHTYTLEWTEESIVWQIDGSTVRTLAASDAQGQYPQTPCQLKIGAWSGGDPSNPQGTIQWAMGPTDYSAGPFTMTVQSVSVVDYSTGSEYTYGDQSGSWSSIESTGGKVNGNVNGAFGQTAADSTTSTGSGAASSIQPWYSGAVTATTYPGLPAGWSVNPETGKVVPPSAAPSKSHTAWQSSPHAVSPASSYSAASYEIKTRWDEQGFLTTVTQQAGCHMHYDDRGFPVTECPSASYPTSIKSKHAHASRDASGVAEDQTKATAKPVGELLKSGAKQAESHLDSAGARNDAEWVVTFGVVAVAAAIAVLLS